MTEASIQLIEPFDSKTQAKVDMLFGKTPEAGPEHPESAVPLTKKEIKQAEVLKKKRDREEKKKNYFTSQDRLSRLERYEALDKNHKLNKKFQGDSNFKGPSRNLSLC